MTDAAIDVNSQHGRVGAQPVQQAGRVATNGRTDNDEFERRKALAGTTEGTLYGGDVTDPEFRIRPRVMCFQNKQMPSPIRNVTNHGELLESVWSVLNGAGDAGVSLEEYRNSITFAGFAGGDGAIYDSTGATQEQSVHFALIKGGLLTVTVQGPMRIRAGDWIMWDLPPPDMARADRGFKGSRQLHPLMLPYTPRLHRAEAKSMKARLVARAAGGGATNTASDDAAVNLGQAFCSALVASLDILAASGLITVNAAALPPEQQGTRDAASRAWRTDGNKTAALETLAKAVGCRGVQGAHGVRNSYKVGQESLASYAANVFAAEDKHLLVPLTARRQAPSGNAGRILTNQRSLVADTVGAAEIVNDERKRRVFAKSITAGGPGEDLDLMGSRYSA